ncbi:MAG: CvpA family protein [Anaerolineales bacterium]|nr:CvpA family protein [Anaerolineales bacterium]
MMSIYYVFWMYVFLFGIIGAMRGWAKELLVIFSVITALAVNTLLRRYLPLVRDIGEDSSNLFWIRCLIILFLVYFGYQTVSFERIAARFGAKARNEKIQDALFGFVLGGVNGYLIAGSILYYNHVAQYPYSHILSRATDPAIAARVEALMAIMPPRFLGEPGIYFAVIAILIFIIIVYI